jgi:phage tail-like protein
MIKIPQTGTFIQLDPVIGWQKSAMEHLSPVNPPGLAANCSVGQPVPAVSPTSLVDCVTGQPLTPASSTASASSCCPASPVTTVTPNSVLSPTGLAVDCVTGQPLPFLPTLASQLNYPVALARDDGGRRLYLLDDAVNRVKELDLDQQREFATITGFGSKGKQARQFRRPRGLAVLKDGSYVIADTGNHQVKIFSGFPNALLAVWGSGSPGSAPGEFSSPWKVVADSCGLIYIADKGNGRIQRIRRDGTSEASIGGLKSPTGLALGPDGTLAVLDSPNIYIYAPGQTSPAQTFPVDAANCITMDDSGCYLYIGTSTALVYKYEAASSGFREVGIGVTGVKGQFLDLLWTPNEQLVGILLAQCAAHPTLVTIVTCGTYLPCGTLTTMTLDSGIENCVWDRIKLNASVPQGTVIEVSTQTNNCDTWASGAAFQAECSAYSAVSTDCPLALTGNNPDCLVQSLPGRYLRVQFQLKTNGIVSPLLRAVQIGFPRSSYLQYLPAVYQEDDQSRVFLDRFLRIFQTTFDGMDRTLDNMWQRFDPLSVPDSWFSWLAAWIALPINPSWTEQQRRAALKSAGQLYPLRGTPAGVQQLIQQYSGVSVRLIEHYRLRQLIILADQPDAGTALGSGTRLWSRDYYQRLQLGVYSRVGYFELTGDPEPDVEPLAWGANEFTVFFDCDPYQVSSTQQNVSQVVEREKPAYTKANYAPVFPRLRVGVQSTLGVDTRIGEATPLLLGTTGTLDYDSILSCSKTESHLLAQHATLRPQVDVNTRLL